MEVRISGAWRTINRREVRIGQDWCSVTRREYYDGSQWRTIATFVPAMTASSSPAVVGGVVPASGTVTTNQVTVTPNGGQSPYTYSWVRTSGTGGTANSPSSANTTFSRFVTSGDATTETFRCTVTDNLGTTATTDVSPTFSSSSINEQEDI